jgi:hypothetical protein
MCDNCQEKELMDNPEELNEEYLDLESIQGTYENSFIPPIELPLEAYDWDKFNDGISEYSFLAGAITALANAGIHPSEALGFIINRETAEHNLKIANINKEMNIEVSKNTQINIEKNQM